MTIPTKIEIQITNSLGHNNPIPNILFHFKIYTADDDYYNTSYFKTDASGKIVLTTQDLIDNSELKWEANDKDFMSSKIEVYALDALTTAELKGISRNYIDETANTAQIEKYLSENGFTEARIQQAKMVIEDTAREQAANYELLQVAANDLVDIITDRIEDQWHDNTPKYYEFVIDGDVS